MKKNSCQLTSSQLDPQGDRALVQHLCFVTATNWKTFRLLLCQAFLLANRATGGGGVTPPPGKNRSSPIRFEPTFPCQSHPDPSPTIFEHGPECNAAAEWAPGTRAYCLMTTLFVKNILLS
jgi:hypothetical protein